VKRFFPLIKKYEIEEDFSGIRPQLKGSGFKDFVIKHEADNGFFGLINLFGIDSPGLTACIAIGKYVKEIYEKEIRRS
jgi:L-2-hydroxyglutarate oxidase LhgO